MNHESRWLPQPSVSRLASDVESAMFGSFGESPETSLILSVLVIAHMIGTCDADTYLFGYLSHAINLIKADSAIDVSISELLLRQ